MNQAADGPAPAARWALAQDAIALIAIDPHGLGGIVLRARAGPVRERWLAALAATLPDRQRKLPAHATEGRLIGGLDLGATLASGRPVAERGLLAQAHGGLITAAMAERMSATVAALLGQALDTGYVTLARDGFSDRHAARFGVVALDESAGDEEHVPAALTDRLAFHLELEGIASTDTGVTAPGAERIALARRQLRQVEVPDALIDALCAAADALGVASLRAWTQAVHAARCCAALDGRTLADESDAALAARLVLAPRATRLPAPPATPQDASEPSEAEPSEAEPPQPPAPPPQHDPADPPAADPPPDTRDAEQSACVDQASLQDIVLAAAAAAIPPGLLARIKNAGRTANRGSVSGRTGAYRKAGVRGRPIGVKPGDRRSGARLSVIETLRAAAPWQRLRRCQPGMALSPLRVVVRAQDFRVLRHRERSETTTIFVVDASGSAAIHRLAEAKGAVELLLADCYVRRDQVALIAFRGSTAETLLPPTRSLVRAKRSLGGLPGGGATPLAAGIDAAGVLALNVRRHGATPTIVFLTDGRANIARDGSPGRARAEADADAAARTFAASGFATLLLDISPRAQPQAQALANHLGAAYLALPYADARGMSSVVRAFLPGAVA